MIVGEWNMFNYENGLVGLYLGYYRNQRSKTDNYFKKKEFINCKSKEILELCKNCDWEEKLEQIYTITTQKNLNCWSTSTIKNFI